MTECQDGEAALGCRRLFGRDCHDTGVEACRNPSDSLWNSPQRYVSR